MILDYIVPAEHIYLLSIILELTPKLSTSIITVYCGVCQKNNVYKCLTANTRTPLYYFKGACIEKTYLQCTAFGVLLQRYLNVHQARKTQPTECGQCK
jgi:hypothetical protein